MVVLDTDILIGHLRGNEKAIKVILELKKRETFLNTTINTDAIEEYAKISADLKKEV